MNVATIRTVRCYDTNVTDPTAVPARMHRTSMPISVLRGSARRTDGTMIWHNAPTMFVAAC